ncbi:MAG: hypothetical protein ABJN96_14150 [Marinomonas sp.]
MSNSAYSLHQILKKGMEHGNNEKTKDVWKSILGIDDDFNIFSKICAVQSLIDETVRTFEIHDPENYKEYLAWLPNIENAFNKQDLSGNWQTFRSAVSPSTLSMLFTSASALNGFTGYTKVSNEELSSLHEKTNKLMGEIKQSDLDHDVQLFILNHLYSILNALDDYQIKGPDYLIEKIERATGSTTLKLHKEKIPKKNLKSFMSYIIDAATIVGLCNGLSDFAGLESPTELLKLAFDQET